MVLAAEGDWPESWPSYELIVALAQTQARSASDGEDLAHSAIARALDFVARTGNRIGTGWFVVALANLRRDRFRRQQGRVVGATTGIDIDALPDAASASRRERALMEDALTLLAGEVRLLPQEMREVLRLRFFENKTVAEIAKALGVSTRTVDRRIEEAMKRLGGRMRTGRGALHPGLVALVEIGRRSGGPATAPAAGKAAKGIKAAAVLGVGTVSAVAVVLAARFAVPSSSDSGLAPLASMELRRESAAGGGALVEPSALLFAGTTDRYAAAAPQVADETGGAGGSTETDSSADADVAGREFKIELTVNGEPATDRNGWRVFRPIFEPDANRDESLTPKSESPEWGDEPGVAVFRLPDVAGIWLFRFEHDATGQAVWIHDEARASAPRGVSLHSAPCTLDAAAFAEAMEAPDDRTVMLGNPEPGVWSACALVAGDAKVGGWQCTAAVMGRNEVVRTSNAFHPDDWPRLLKTPIHVSH